MSPLSLKVLPPFQVLTLGAVMWLVHRYVPVLHHHFGWEFSVSRILLYACLLLFLATIYQFWKHKTTVSPTNIGETSALITGGVFAFTRNPIYVIDALLLLAWAIWLGQWLNLLMPLVFAWYCTRYQIIPEELMLREKFPEAYADYSSRVRRWL